MPNMDNDNSIRTRAGGVLDIVFGAILILAGMFIIIFEISTLISGVHFQYTLSNILLLCLLTSIGILMVFGGIKLLKSGRAG
jgi:predicted phage tail protein